MIKNKPVINFKVHYLIILVVLGGNFLLFIFYVWSSALFLGSSESRFFGAFCSFCSSVHISDVLLVFIAFILDGFRPFSNAVFS